MDHCYIVVEADSLDTLVPMVNSYVNGVAWDRDTGPDVTDGSLIHMYDPTAPPTKLDGKYIVPMVLRKTEWTRVDRWSHWVPGTRTAEDTNED